MIMKAFGMKNVTSAIGHMCIMYKFDRRLNIFCTFCIDSRMNCDIIVIG